MEMWKWLKTNWDAGQIREWSSIRKALYVLLSLLLYSLFTDIMEILLWFVLNVAAGHLGDLAIACMGMYSETITGVIYGAAAVLGLLPFKGLIHEEISCVIKKENLPKTKELQKYVWLVLLALGSSFCLNFVMSSFSIMEKSKGYGAVAEAQYGVVFFVGLFLYGVVSPVTEEVIYRGITYNRFKRAFGKIPAMLLSAVLFGFFHGNVVQAVYGMLMGILLAWCYEKYEGFLAPVLFHMAANLGIYSATYGNRLSQLSPKSCIFGAVFSFLITLVSLFFIQKCFEGRMKEEFQTKSPKA